MNKFKETLGKVAVLMGGTSAERDISLMSGNGVLHALKSLGVDAYAFDPAKQNIFSLQKEGFSRAFIALHGRGGEDGCIQGCLETMGIPYTGSGVMASALCMDKVMTKRVWQAHGLPTPGWLSIEPQEVDAHPPASIVDALGLPLIVKPASEGSSIGVNKVLRVSDLQSALYQASQFDAPVLCETYIEGEEVTCAVMGEGSSATALPVVRIVPPSEGYDFQNKYYTEAVRYYCPSGLSIEEEQNIQAITLEAYKALGCRGWGRADLMIRAKDRKPFLLEMNTAPGMTDHSLVPLSAKAAAIGYADLCLKLLSNARLDRLLHFAEVQSDGDN